MHIEKRKKSNRGKSDNHIIYRWSKRQVQLAQKEKARTTGNYFTIQEYKSRIAYLRQKFAPDTPEGKQICEEHKINLWAKRTSRQEGDSRRIKDLIDLANKDPEIRKEAIASYLN